MAARARCQRAHLAESHFKPVEAEPQGTGDLYRSEDASAFGQRDFQVRPAHIVAGGNGHDDPSPSKRRAVIVAALLS